MIGIPAFILIVVVVVILLIATTSSSARQTPSRTCRVCGADHPPFARFCRRCGKKL